ncbi:hypothetical protein Tco_1509534 [Tanacetum coccineum]
MIQPEPEDLPKDNPKLEIAVLRVILFSIHNDEWKSFQCHHQTALRSVINELTSGEIVSLNFIESIKEARSRVQDLTSGEIVSLNLLSRTRKFGHSTMELRSLIIKECECLAQKLSKQTESVNKEVHNNLLKSFSKLEKHSISLELALQQCKEQMKNNSVCKENGSNVFRKEREQYHEIQDLKAQMQDKNIAISELKKLIENCKGKSVETQFNKPSVVRQPNAQRIPKPSVLGKPTPFSNSPEMRSFQTKQSVNKTNVSDGLFKQVTQQNLPQIRKQAVRNTNVIAPGPSRNCPKHVSHQSPREKVGSNDMVHNYYLEKAKKSAQLQKDKEVNGKPSMIDPARLPNTANGCKPKPRNWQASMSSRVSNKDVHLGEHRKQKPFLKFNELQCPTCKKCLYSANHDECVLEYLSKLNPRASAQIKDAKSHNTTKRYVPVEKSSASKKPERQIPTGHRFSNKKTTTVPEKTRTPRSCLRWQPTGRILKTVCLRWVPTGRLFNSCTSKVESEPTHGSNVDIPHIHACKQTLGLSAAVQASVVNVKWRLLKITLQAPTRNSRPQQRTVKFKAGSKSCSLSKQDSYITTRVGITIPPSYSNAEDNRIHDEQEDEISNYQQQETGKQEKNQMGLLTMDDGIVQLGNNTEAKKQIKGTYGYRLKQLMKSLKDIGGLGMKAVKTKEQLQKIVDSWKDSSKNLWRLIDSGMSSNKDSIGKPSYSRFTKTNNFKGVPLPLNGDYTPKPQEEIDDSMPKVNSVRPKVNAVNPKVTRINWRILKNSMGDLLPLEVAKATYLEEPKKIAEALQDDSWVQAMQEELLQFKLQQVWVLVDLPHGMKVIGTKDKKDIMLVQVYVDDIIFGSTNKSWCDEFETLMKSIFQMSSMGELTFFLAAITPMETKVPLTKDEESFDVDVTPKTSHLNAVKRIFKYLKGKPNLGLWYPRESPIDWRKHSLIATMRGPTFDRNPQHGFNFLGSKTYLMAILLFAGISQEHDAVAQSQPSSSTPPVPSTSSPQVQSTPPPIPIPTPPPIPTPTPPPTPTPTPTPIPETGRTRGRHMSLILLEASQNSLQVPLLNKDHDKGRSYKRRKETKGKKVVSSLVFQEEVDTGAEEVNTAEGVNTGSIKLSTISEQVSTSSAKKSIPSPDKGQRAGKAPMIIKETPKKSKEQILQEEASLAEAIRLDTLQKEEVAKQVHLDSLLAQRIAEEEELNKQQKKRKAQVQFEAQHYTDEDWDLIRAKIEANAELSKSMLGSDLQGEDFAKKMVDLVNQRKKYFAEERARAKRNKPMTELQLKTYMMNYLKNQGTWKLSQQKNLSFEEVKEEFDKLVKQVESFAPINFEATKASLKRFGEELQTKTTKRLKNDEAKDDEPAKKSGKRRKQMARKGLHTDLDKDDSEGSGLEVSWIRPIEFSGYGVLIFIPDWSLVSAGTDMPYLP